MFPPNGQRLRSGSRTTWKNRHRAKRSRAEWGTVLFRILIAGLAATFALVGSAVARDQIQALGWIRAPATAPMAAVAHIKLTNGQMALGASDTSRFLQLNGNPPADNNFVISAPEFRWFAAYVFDPSGYVTLASIIEGEASDQGLIGMQAVAAVIANRAAAGGFGGSSLIDVALARGQFQGRSANYSQTAWNVVGDLLAGSNPDPTGGATFYANPKTSSLSWARNLNPSNSVQIGDHFFTDNQQGIPFTGRRALPPTSLGRNISAGSAALREPTIR